MLKRTFDVIASLAGVVVLSPVLAIVAIAIKAGDGGPVFYRGARVGQNGVPFRMFKFRTMILNADKVGGPSTAGDDPRLTSVGGRLRKYKLDELPQLFNVLTGEMSLVGPRPEVQEYVAMFTDEERAILSVRPGVTDWASLWNSNEGALLAGSPDPERTYLEEIRPEKVRLQLRYVRQHTFLTDLEIISRTLLAIISRHRSTRTFMTTPPNA